MTAPAMNEQDHVGLNVYLSRNGTWAYSFRWRGKLCGNLGFPAEQEARDAAIAHLCELARDELPIEPAATIYQPRAFPFPW